MLDIEVLKVLADLGSAGAVIIVAIIFIRYIRSRDKIAEEKDSRWIHIMSNHMSEEIKAFTHLTEAINHLIEKKDE